MDIKKFEHTTATLFKMGSTVALMLMLISAVSASWGWVEFSSAVSIWLVGFTIWLLGYNRSRQ